MDKKISFNKEDEKDLKKNDEDGNIIEQLRIFYEEKLKKQKEENEAKVKMLEKKNKENEAKLKKRKEENDIKDKKIMELNNELKLKNYLKNIELNNLTINDSKTTIINLEENIKINNEINKAQYNDNKIILEKHLKKVSKKVYEESINMIIDDLGDSFNDLESVINKLYEEKKNNIKNQIFKIFEENYQIKKKDLKEIIIYLRDNKDLLFKKKLYYQIINMINLIENFKDEIYMDEENKNLQKKENYTKIGKEKLNSMIKIDQTLEKEINNFIKQPTELIFNFFKLNQSDNFYDTIKICENTYKIESELKLPLKNFVSYNGFESQLNIELNKNNIKKKFLINVTLYTKNFYDISIDIKKEETFSAEIVFVSNQKDLLPNNITISNKILFINDSLLNMKRIILLNITKNDLFNYLEKFSFFNEKKKN